MREIVFDTETTGFDPESGDRVVEIGAIELKGHMPTGNVFHRYIDPERDMPQGAFEVHGLSSEFLRGKPKFAEVAAEWIAFVGDARLVAHNAEFDFKFMNAELRRAGHPPMGPGRMVDSLAIARKRFPGARNSLDALCARFGVDNSAREKHGALLDSELLAEVYLELIGGRQPGLELAAGGREEGEGGAWRPPPRPTPLPPRITDAEAKAHAAFVATLDGGGRW
ncbi:DNA polymerase-3 subunit epsilon [Hasllibacter halocynthiae]|uniref:DNA polymerase III subunit epsilon n=1 Tax=Hasllibacter halocynthiae TaxID=595589 RepID=A0A2T0X2F3_9RHOB|nr:DNA polymerase III subunit epsilon [Hasllibacter halocynthiae]PRY93132.1 DNA polymerase-3 subunit epsilon [Hasllibacter halocynthiae]